MIQPAAVHSVHDRAENDPRRGFASPRAFLLAAMKSAGHRNRSDVADERLRPLAVSDHGDDRAGGEVVFLLPAAFTPRTLLAAAGSDEQGGYSDSYGGFAAPPAAVFPGILSAVEEDPTAGRTRGFPMDVPQLDIPARTDKDHATSLTGGFTVSRNPETIAFPASRGEMELVSLRAASLVGLDYATEEIMMDSAGSFAALVASGFRDEMSGTLLREKIRGGGGNEFLGVLSSPARIVVDKEAGQSAATIVGENVYKMAERCWRYSGAIWLANPDCRRAIYKLTLPIGTAGAPIYLPPVTEGSPDMLLGRPLYFTEHCSTLGTEGDLIACRWSEYLEGTLQHFQSAESIHVRFIEHERVLKFWLRNAGAPWWRSALTPANSTVTLSPVVTLAARA